MNVLLVGGAGYIGSHMTRYLVDHTEDRVVVLDNLARGHRAAVRGAELVVGDCGDAALVEDLCRARGITALLHFGADSQVGESTLDPAKYYENNVVNGKRMLDGAKAAGVRHVIFSSTAAVYGEPASLPITEESRLQPTSPYGRTKLAFEGLLQSYAEAYGITYTALRYFNAAGADLSGEIGEDHAPETHLIPLVLQVALGRHAAIGVFGADYPTPDGTGIRDYIHVTDLAAAHLLALRRLVDGAPSAIYNLGNGEGFSVREIIAVCRAVTGHPIPEEVQPRRAGDPAQLVAGAARARRELGWRPRYADLRTIVESAWAWHRTHPAGY